MKLWAAGKGALGLKLGQIGWRKCLVDDECLTAVAADGNIRIIVEAICRTDARWRYTIERGKASLHASQAAV